jgi:DNA-binding NarL/FixJ family response regulator
VEELIHAIEVVMAGNLYLSAEVSAEIVEDYQKTLTGKVDSSKSVLSKREKQLLRLIAMGLRNKEIASELKLSPNSIETYRARLMKKVGYRNTAELVRFAIREGIAPL